jgi:C4-dicarboxylate-binding protein DctP
MAFSEVFGALQQGVVDGQFNTWSNTYTQKFHEVQRYGTITGNLEYLAYAVVVNKEFWDRLTPETRTIFEGAMKEATDYVWNLAQQENDDAFEKIKASGRLEFYEWTQEDKEAAKKAVQPVYAEYEPKIGKDIIERVQQEGA